MTESQAAQLLDAVASLQAMLTSVDDALGVLAFGMWFGVGWYITGFALNRSRVDFAK
jgi:hypothetical protein